MALLGGTVTRSHFANALEANLRKGYVEEYKILSARALYPRIYNLLDSDGKIERFTVNAGLGTFPTKPENDAFDYDAPQEAWTQNLTNVEYALGVSVSMTAMEDDMHGLIKKSLRQNGGALMKVAMYTKERDAMTLFNSTLTSGTAYTAGGTNYSVLATNHFRVDGGTWSNKFASSTDLSIEALEAAIQHWMANQKNQRGQISMVMPTTLMVAPGNVMLARRIVNSVKLPQSADNDPNPAGSMIDEIIEHPLLTNDGRWLLFAPKDERRLPYIERVRPNVFRQPDGDNGASRWVGRYRCVSGLVDPIGTFGTD